MIFELTGLYVTGDRFHFKPDDRDGATLLYNILRESERVKQVTLWLDGKMQWETSR
jgi:hypothetical protein